MKRKVFWYSSIVLLGLVVGYGYYHFYGCTNGCSITGSPWKASLYFGAMFFLGGNIIIESFNKKKS
ncbi:MAG: hypothetical protein ACKO4K_01515 [Flavobacteriales bacterium]